jgi:hypothetical protein
VAALQQILRTADRLIATDRDAHDEDRDQFDPSVSASNRPGS